MEAVLSFDELPLERLTSAGGKGGTLARLCQTGYPVPDGLVILPAACTGDELRPDAWAQVPAHLARLRGNDPQAAFAVRSSALAEDSARASFAGEGETVLDVHSDEAVRQAIGAVRCHVTRRGCEPVAGRGASRQATTWPSSCAVWCGPTWEVKSPGNNVDPMQPIRCASPGGLWFVRDGGGIRASASPMPRFRRILESGPGSA